MDNLGVLPRKWSTDGGWIPYAKWIDLPEFSTRKHGFYHVFAARFLGGFHRTLYKPFRGYDVLLDWCIPAIGQLIISGWLTYPSEKYIKIWVSWGPMTFPIYGKSKSIHVPKHQSVWQLWPWLAQMIKNRSVMCNAKFMPIYASRSCVPHLEITLVPWRPWRWKSRFPWSQDLNDSPISPWK